MSKIQATFERLRAQGRKALIPFITAGDPDPALTVTLMHTLVEAGADIIMLDNMSDEDMRKAVTLIAGRAKTECSGNVTRENIARLRDIGIDYVSSGALTHSAPILDLSMKHLRPLTAEEA